MEDAFFWVYLETVTLLWMSEFVVIYEHISTAEIT
jgi:hypothetical protein